MTTGHDDTGPFSDRTTRVERISDRELRVTRVFDAPARIVFAAWTTPALFMRWWAPKSVGARIVGCDMDVRTGGGYRLEFAMDGMDNMEFFGRYLEVIPDAKLVWTNEEDAEGAVTTVTFEEKEGRTHLTYLDLYPSKEALDEATDGMGAAMPEQFDQLDTLLAAGDGPAGL